MPLKYAKGGKIIAYYLFANIMIIIVVIPREKEEEVFQRRPLIVKFPVPTSTFQPS